MTNARKGGLTTLGEEFNRAEADNYGKKDGKGALEMGIVRGEFPGQLGRKVIVEVEGELRHLFFIDPMNHEKAERVLTLMPMPPIGYG